MLTGQPGDPDPLDLDEEDLDEYLEEDEGFLEDEIGFGFPEFDYLDDPLEFEPPED